MGSKHSQGNKSLYLKLKLSLLGGLSYWLAGVLGKIDNEYSATYLKRHGQRRLNELLHEEAEYWRGKYHVR